jgi:ABC-2 type transport system permease protein
VWLTLSSSPDFHHLVQGYSEQAAIASLGKGTIYAVIVVPKGFANDMGNNAAGHIILYTDDSEPGLSDQVESTLKTDIQNFDPNVEVQPIRFNASAFPVQIIQKGTIFASFNVGLTIILGIVQIFAGFYEIAGGMSREREEGTFARMLLSPINVGSIMLGKTIYDLLLATARTFIVLVFAEFVYGARPNTDIITLLGLSLLIALVTIGLGFVVSALKVGTRAVVILEFFMILSLFAFSGLVIDKELLQGISRTISNLLPFTYGFDALKRTILLGEPLLNLSTDLQSMIGSAMLFYGLSYVLLVLRREKLST